MNTELNDPNDPIALEIPIYLSSQLSRHLHLFQFPTRTKPFSSSSHPTCARYRPRSNVLQLDIPLDTNAPTFDPIKAEDFSAAANGRRAQTVYDQMDVNEEASSADPFLASSQKPQKLDKITMSATLVPPMTNYYVGVFRDGGLYLTQLTSTLQFSPQLTHLDESHRLEKEAKKRVDEEEKKARGENVEKKPVTLNLPRVETEEMMAARRKSITYLKKEQENEPFVKLAYFHDHTEEADAVYARLFGLYHQPISASAQSSAYLSRLAPHATETLTPEVAVLKPAAVSKEDVRHFDVHTRIRCLLINAQLLPEETIMREISASEMEILAALAQCAVPVKGVWVVRSDLLYTGHRTVARDFLVHLFAMSQTNPPTVSRKAFADVVQIDLENTKEILQGLADLMPASPAVKREAGTAPQKPMWQFKYKTTTNEQHPLYVEFIRGPLQTALEHLGIKSAAAKNNNNRSAPAPTQRSESSRNTPALARAPSAVTQADPVTTAIVSHVAQHGVVSADDLFNHLSTTLGQDAPPTEELAAKIESKCLLLHGAYVLRSRDPKYEQIRQVVLDLYSQSTTVKKNEIIKTVKERTGRDTPVNAFVSIMSELSLSTKSPYLWKTLKP